MKHVIVSLACVACLTGLTRAQAQQTEPAAAAVTVPRLVNFGGVIKDPAGKTRTGSVALTFSIYPEQDSRTPLWQETQSLELDDQGRYTVQLGTTSREIPLELFTSGKPLWLGVQPRMEGAVEQSRVLLASVPYALKAVDADTLGGKPASAFVTQDSLGAWPGASVAGPGILPAASLGSPFRGTAGGNAGIGTSSRTATLEAAGPITVDDLAPSVNNRTLFVAPGRVRFGTEVCSNFSSVSTASISSGATAGIAKLYVTDSCAIVLEYSNALHLTLVLNNIIGAAVVSSPSVPATALYLADVNIDAGGFAFVTDKRSILAAFSAMAGSGIVIDCSTGPCLFSIDPAVVMTLGGTSLATGVEDNRRAAQTFPAQVAASDPPTCIVAQQYFNTTTNVRKDCTASNTWTTLGASGNSSTLYQKIDSQAGFTTAVSSTTPRVVSTSIPSIGAGQCVQWSWTGWANTPGLKVAVAYGTASLSVPGDPGNGSTITGTICNNRGVQNAQTLSASSSPGMALQHAASNVNAATPQTLTLTMTGATGSATGSSITAGLGDITASAPAATISAIASARATVSPSSGIIVPANTALQPGLELNFPVTLANPAPAGGVFITLTSSDPSTVTVAPENIFIPEGASAPNRSPVVNGINAGSATITATASGLASATGLVQVTSGGGPISPINLPASTTVGLGLLVSLPVILGSPAPAGGVNVLLASSDTSKVQVTPTVFIAGGATSPATQPAVNGIGAGLANITASAPGYTPGSGQVQVVGSISPINLPASTTVGLGLLVSLPVTLGSPAPAGGVNVLLASSDTSKVQVTPTVFIAGGATSSATQPTVNGIGVGLANITASAPGYTPGSGQVQVVASGGGNSFFSPASLAIAAGSTGNLTLSLSGPAPANLTASLSSNNTGAATVPGSLTFAVGATSVNVPVSGVGAGAATITAITPGFGNATASAIVSASASTSVTTQLWTVSQVN